MKAKVTYVVNGTTHSYTWRAPRISTQHFRGGRANIILLDKDGKILRTVQYRKAEIIIRSGRRAGGGNG